MHFELDVEIRVLTEDELADKVPTITFHLTLKDYKESSHVACHVEVPETAIVQGMNGEHAVRALLIWKCLELCFAFFRRQMSKRVPFVVGSVHGTEDAPTGEDIAEFAAKTSTYSKEAGKKAQEVANLKIAEVKLRRGAYRFTPHNGGVEVYLPLTMKPVAMSNGYYLCLALRITEYTVSAGLSIDGRIYLPSLHRVRSQSSPSRGTPRVSMTVA